MSDDLPSAVAEDLATYVEWNKLTRHQLIVAHMTLVRSIRHHEKTLATALGSQNYGLSILIGMACDKIKSTP